MAEDEPRLWVVAGVLRDGAGRVLLAQRAQGKAHAGLWEFPGGKVEPGESATAALTRELQEELGINAQVSERVIRVPVAAPTPMWLDAWRISDWDGEPRGMEGQALRWCNLDTIDASTLPPADVPVLAALRDPALLAISPEPGLDDAGEQAWLRYLLEGVSRFDVGRVVLRAPAFARAYPAHWRHLVLDVAAPLRRLGVDVWVHADVELARAAGAGLHLTSAQLQGLVANEVPHMLAGIALAASCHDAQQLGMAQALRCCYAVLSPVKPTLSHPGAPALGWRGFAQRRAQVPGLAVYALGGMMPEDLSEARLHGAQGIAAIRGLMRSD